MKGLLYDALEHISRLLQEKNIPPLEGDLAEIPVLKKIHEDIKSIREIQSSLEALKESESRFKYLANHDPLTGAMNRRSFMERAVSELNEACRFRYPCGLIMMDIDHFKVFNDTYGHQAGDEALRHIVKIISEFSRAHDFCGRYGGEEFIFFFCHADQTTSLIVAERIRSAIQNHPVKLETGTAPITASLGIAMARLAPDMKIEQTADYLEILIHHADTAMYKAKKTGRNKVVIHDEDDATPVEYEN